MRTETHAQEIVQIIHFPQSWMSFTMHNQALHITLAARTAALTDIQQQQRFRWNT